MSLLVAFVASIPSPSRSDIHVGPLVFRAYGLCIAVGVLAAVAVTQRRWARKGGDPADIASIATGSVIAGLVGARLYHVITDWRRFEGRWFDVVKVWEGGLGIPGGLVLGVLTGVYLARRRGMHIPSALDAVAPALPVAQAIGRLGNWFNQELFGGPTTLPWGLEIDPVHRPVGYENVATFHPTFLYEAGWNLALAGLLIAWDNRHLKARPGRVFACYVGGYGLGRLWVESLRIDEASRIAGVRVNIWTSLIAIAAAAAWLALRGRRDVPVPDYVSASAAARAAAARPDGGDDGAPDPSHRAGTDGDAFDGGASDGGAFDGDASDGDASDDGASDGANGAAEPLVDKPST